MHKIKFKEIKSKKKLKLNGSNSLTLMDPKDQGFEEVGEEKFFKKDG